MIEEEIINGCSFTTIENNAHLKVVLSTLGAGIFAIYFDNQPMTLTLKNKSDYFNEELFHGKTIGPVCGRIKDGKIGSYQYDLNEGSVTSHGGKNGLSTKLFSFDYKEDNDCIIVSFTLNSFLITYKISKDVDTFSINYLYNGESQPISLTNHPFFHLNGSFEELNLQINSDYFIENDSFTLAPISKREIIPCLDFSKSKRINEDIDDKYLMAGRTKGYDHYLHFANKREIILRNNEYELNIDTDFDGVLIYSDNYDFKEETIDHREGIRKALAVEPQDSPLERKIFGGGNKYQRFIKYSFKKR
ncbi:MAG: hypothetical protein J6X50_00805 [Bacilli bacterium]|nr:hypothetical protein [Bacilli bacterium]